MKSKFWIIGFLLIVLCTLAGTAYKTAYIDPFFHYHKPLTDKYSYRLNNERSQNDGIMKHFDYTGIITGTSMAENFKTTEAENLWGEKFIKVGFSGGSFKEINENMKTAASYNKDLKIVIHGLDIGSFLTDKDYMRTDMGNHPVYLYDDNIFNDVKYLLNRDVVFQRVYKMEKARKTADFSPGITSFDKYMNWMKGYKFGKNSVIPDGILITDNTSFGRLSKNKIAGLKKNIRQNLTDIADAYPDITFYYFITPYSALFWLDSLNDGTLKRRVAAERVVIEEMLKHENIKFFSFNSLFDITTDLNNYKDRSHYGEWINSLMLRYMHDEKYLLTKDNYEQYLAEIEDFYLNYDYSLMTEKEDYENDYYAAALLIHEITGTEAKPIDLNNTEFFELSSAVIKDDLYEGIPGVVCTGALQRSADDPAADSIRDKEYAGIKIPIEDAAPYKYLVFYGRKISGNSQPMILIYDENGAVLKSWYQASGQINNERHQYLIDISELEGPAVLVLNGGAPTKDGSPDSQYEFSGICLY